jgi:hypothetical protein
MSGSVCSMKLVLKKNQGVLWMLITIIKARIKQVASASKTKVQNLDSA